MNCFLRIAAVVLLGMSCMPGCVSDRHLFFFTDTTVGLEVAPVGSSTSTPRVVVAYSRKEGVIQPVGAEEGSTEERVGDLTLRDEAYSVLAKYEGGTKATNAGTSNAQWFATGEAAKVLAGNPLSMAAVTGSPEVAASIERASAESKAELRVRNMRIINAAHSVLEGAKDSDGKAHVLLDEMDALEKAIKIEPFRNFAYSQVNNTLRAPVFTTTSGFHAIYETWTTLPLTIKQLDAAVANPGIQANGITIVNDANPTTAASLQAERDKQEIALKNLESDLRDHTDLFRRAIEYAVEISR